MPMVFAASCIPWPTAMAAAETVWAIRNPRLSGPGCTARVRADRSHRLPRPAGRPTSTAGPTAEPDGAGETGVPRRSAMAEAAPVPTPAPTATFSGVSSEVEVSRSSREKPRTVSGGASRRWASTVRPLIDHRSRNITIAPSRKPTIGDSTMGSRTFWAMFAHWTVAPAANRVAPTRPPKSACDDDEGRPKYHVSRFQLIAPRTPAKTTPRLAIPSREV